MGAVSALLRQLLFDPECVPAVQQAVFDRAIEYQDLKCLAAMADHPALDPGIDARLGELADAEVTAAWLARPGRPVDEIVSRLGAERRDKVLCALAACDDLPPAAYRTMAANVRTRKAAIALMVSDAAPLDARVTAAKVAGQRASDWQLYQAVNEVKDPEVLAAMAAATEHRDLLLLAAPCPALAEDTVRRVYHDAIRPAIETWTGTQNYAKGQAAAAAARGLSQLAVNPALPADLRVELTDWADSVLARGLPTSGYAASAIRTALESAARDLSNPPPTLSSDELTVAGVLDEAHRLGIPRVAEIQEKVRILASRPDCSPEDLRSLTAVMALTTAKELRRPLTARPEMLAVLGGCFPHLATDEVLEAVPDQASLLAAIMTEARQHHGRTAPTTLLRSRFLGPEHLGSWPVSGLRQLKSYPRALTALGQYLVQRLGDNPDRWSMLDRLATEWESSPASLDDLVEAVCAAA